MSKLLRVNMAEKTVAFEDLGEYARFGGRALSSMIVSKEVPPACHPLGRNNKLVFATGLLCGTSAANAGRLSVGAKSPLTGGIKESNVGGSVADMVAALGLRGVVIEGQPASGELYYLLVNKDGASLEPADEYKGLKNYDLAEKLHAKHGKKAGIMSIGPAGEMRMSAASVAATDDKGRPSRHAGRGGMGAVMGAKGLKAVVLDKEGGPGVEYHDKDAFREAAKTFREALTSHDTTKPGGLLSVYGTDALMGPVNAAGALPTRNFSTGNFEGVAGISGETLHDTIKARGGETTHSACSNCVIQCSNVYLDENKEYKTSGFEYETIWAHGANCGINDLESIAEADRLCDDYGRDTIEMGCAIGVAMDAGVKEFGDGPGAIELLNEVGAGTPLGRILGNGAAVTGQTYGVERVPVVKRQGLPAYDPRSIKGIGVTYATTPMGADHTAGYAVTTNLSGKVDGLKPDGQVDLSRALQLTTASLDSAGLCIFVAFAALDIPEGAAAIPKMLNALLGWELGDDGLAAYGQEVIAAELAFNKGAGFSNEDDRLPEFFVRDELAPHGTVFDVPDEELDQTFTA
ncbi:MAG: aldehyde ferredoxin oxidoreductase C-terminal domain-containing protein [Candidatus Hydrogenedentes bacterium]|nr:aldehyde ferredoxin oxidoreductase C-terminal domain-containing protein [Candidatus Hydrogenedentota bacterium]